MGQDPGLIDGIPNDVNNVISIDQPLQLQAIDPGSTVTASQDFPFTWNGVIINFFAGETTVVSPDLQAALIAQGAPVTTP